MSLVRGKQVYMCIYTNVAQVNAFQSIIELLILSFEWRHLFLKIFRPPSPSLKQRWVVFLQLHSWCHKTDYPHTLTSVTSLMNDPLPRSNALIPVIDSVRPFAIYQRL